MNTKNTKVLTVNRKGLSHRRDNKACDDAVSVNEKQTVICLCDGVTNCAAGGKAAETLSREMNAFLSCDETIRLLEGGSLSDIRINVHNRITKIINRLCYESGLSASDFGTTFMALVRVNNNIILLHCDDGAILGMDTTGSVTLISAPRHHALGSVDGAYSDKQRRFMRVFRLPAENYNAILLATDGFTDSFLDVDEMLFDTDAAIKFLNCSSSSRLNKWIDSINIDLYAIDDDISCALYNVHSFFKDETGNGSEKEDLPDSAPELVHPQSQTPPLPQSFARETYTHEIIPADNDCAPPDNSVRQRRAKSKQQRKKKIIKLQALFAAIFVYMFLYGCYKNFLLSKKVDIAFKIQIQQQEQIEKLQIQLESFEKQLSSLQSEIYSTEDDSEDIVAPPAYSHNEQGAIIPENNDSDSEQFIGQPDVPFTEETAIYLWTE